MSSSWQDICGRSLPSAADRDARRSRFAAVLDSYRSTYGDGLPTIVKITGTSGKGSASAMLEAALRRDGVRTGLFTSPHLVEPTERIRINGSDVSNTQLDEVAREVSPIFDNLIRARGPQFRPSFFESLLVLALRLFARNEVEVAVLEVAIGGYNDVVSLIPGPLAAITSIGLDHAAELGPSLVDIATDKAGIATNHSTLVLGPSIDDIVVEAVLRDTRSRGVTLRFATRRVLTSRSLGLQGHDVRVVTPDSEIAFHLPLAGDFQLDNLATVVTLFQCLHEMGSVTSFGSLAGSSATRWPARLEFFEGRPAWLLDAGHNLPSFQAIRSFVSANLSQRNLTLMFGASDGDKAAEGLGLLAPLFRQIYLVEGFYRSIRVEDVAALAPGMPPHISFSSPENAIEEALVRLACDEEVVVVVGSVFLAGSCRRHLLKLGYSTPKGDRHEN